MSQITARFHLMRPASSSAEAFSLDVDLNLPATGVTAIFGHSGCGKTTLLRCIAGLEQPDTGYLRVNDEIWQDGPTSLATHQRSLGYVFQQPSLFPHLNVSQNLAFAIKRSHRKADPQLYTKTLQTLAINNRLHHSIEQLSGGEQQRVAIARAILMQPKLLLMDEPLASLDNQRKQEILPYLETLTKELQTPIIYVSHSMDEVARLADHAVVMDRGKVTANGSVGQVFSRAGVTGIDPNEAGAIWQGTVTDIDTHWQLIRIAVNGGELWLPSQPQITINSSVKVRLLAKDISLTLNPDTQSSISNCLSACVVELIPQSDAMILVRLSVGDGYLLAQITRRSASHLKLQPGLKLWAQIKSAAITR